MANRDDSVKAWGPGNVDWQAWQDAIASRAKLAGTSVQDWVKAHRAQDKILWEAVRRQGELADRSDTLRSAPSDGWRALSCRAQAMGHGWQVVR